MDILQRIGNAGIVPVVVIEDTKNAVPAAKAMLEGGIDVMEITFRTAAAADSIKAVSEGCPDMLVGAGTVLTLEQCKKAVSCGAKFIVSPGFDEEIARFCLESDTAAIPGCVTATEIMAAMKIGLNVLKFFPANVYGGLHALNALSAPFAGVKFIPTGGIDESSIAEFIRAPFVHAVGGSWLCAEDDISAGNFEKITALCKKARRALLGFEVVHVGINSASAAEAQDIADKFAAAFDMPSCVTSKSVFASDGIEIMNFKNLGDHGHIAIGTNSVDIAIAHLAKRGFEMNMETATYKNGRINLVYLKDQIGGFAVHLMQR